MLTLKIYNGEVFERSKWRYIWFTLIIFAIIVLSLFYKSGEKLQGLIGAIILLIIVGWYFFFIAKANTETQLLLKLEGLQIGKRLIPYSLLKGFVLEMEKRSWKLKNIVLVLEKSVEIFTLNDTLENQESFFAELAKIVPFLDSYEQGMVDKLMRKIKL